MSQKYLEEMFLHSLPVTLGNRPRQVGCEEEFPVVDRLGHAVDCRQILFDALQLHGWDPYYDRVYRQERLGVEDQKSRTIITTDAGWSTLEIILPPLTSINGCKDLLGQILDIVVPILATEGYFLLGLGIQPRLTPNTANWTKQSRNDVIRPVLSPGVDSITLGSSSQASVDVTQDETIPALNIFRALSGVIHALTADSPLLAGQHSNHLAVRGSIWDLLVPQGSHRHGVGPRFANWQEYINYLLQERLLIVFDPTVSKYQPYNRPFADYLQEVTDPVRRQDALTTHQCSVWTDARFKLIGTEQGKLVRPNKQGVIEVRPACQQPQDAKLAVAALVLGVVERLADAQKLIGCHPWDTWEALRINAIHSGLAARTPSGVQVLPLAERLLAIAYDGLVGRKLGEETFLGPFYDRLRRKKTPAEDLLAILPATGELTDQDFARLVQARRYRTQDQDDAVARTKQVGRTLSTSVASRPTTGG